MWRNPPTGPVTNDGLHDKQRVAVSRRKATAWLHHTFLVRVVHACRAASAMNGVGRFHRSDPPIAESQRPVPRASHASWGSCQIRRSCDTVAVLPGPQAAVLAILPDFEAVAESVVRSGRPPLLGHVSADLPGRIADSSRDSPGSLATVSILFALCSHAVAHAIVLNGSSSDQTHHTRGSGI